MALINCPECNAPISDKASSCPKCGCPITEEMVVSIKERIRLAEETRREEARLEEEAKKEESLKLKMRRKKMDKIMIFCFIALLLMAVVILLFFSNKTFIISTAFIFFSFWVFYDKIKTGALIALIVSIAIGWLINLGCNKFIDYRYRHRPCPKYEILNDLTSFDSFSDRITYKVKIPTAYDIESLDRISDDVQSKSKSSNILIHFYIDGMHYNGLNYASCNRLHGKDNIEIESVPATLKYNEKQQSDIQELKIGTWRAVGGDSFIFELIYNPKNKKFTLHTVQSVGITDNIVMIRKSGEKFIINENNGTDIYTINPNGTVVWTEEFMDPIYSKGEFRFDLLKQFVK